MLLCLAFAAPVAAQSRLFVQGPDGTYHPVIKAVGDEPYFMGNGALQPATGRRYALRAADEYLPVLIGVYHRGARTSVVKGWSMLMEGGDATVDNVFHFSADFESPFALPDVFLVLELQFAGEDTKLLLHEVGKLQPRTPLPVSFEQKIDRNSSPEKLYVHLFVRGSEAFTSEQPAAYRNQMLDRMVAKRVASVKQGGLAQLYCPAPPYPPSLLASRVKGRAVVSFRVTPQGTVLDSSVESASAGAFGDAALAAVQEWRFVPRVKDGQAVETRVSIPFAFDPPPIPGA
jgi:TonB family protein